MWGNAEQRAFRVQFCGGADCERADLRQRVGAYIEATPRTLWQDMAGGRPQHVQSLLYRLYTKPWLLRRSRHLFAARRSASWGVSVELLREINVVLTIYQALVPQYSKGDCRYPDEDTL